MSSQPFIQKKHGLSIPSTAMFLVGLIAGTGILALPKAVEDIGWAGLILLALYTILNVYTGILLGDTWTLAANLFDDCKGHVSNPYQLLGEKTFGKIGRGVVSVCVYVNLCGCAVVFLLLTADNMENLVTALGLDISFCFWLVIIAGCLVPLTWFGTPKDFWFIAYIAALASVTAAMMIVIGVGLDSRQQPTARHSPADIQNVALALGTIAFTLAGHPGLLTFQMDMKRQSDIKWAVICGFSISFLLYLPVSSAGYFVYGKALDANILNNFPSGGLSYVILILVTSHLVLAIVIILSPVNQELEMFLNVPKEFTWKRCATRLCVVACILFIAESIPKFNVILSLLGGTTMTLLSYVCPVLFHMKMCQFKTEFDAHLIQCGQLDEIQAPLENGKTWIPLWRKVLNCEIIGIGMLAGLAVSVSAVITIISPDSFSKPCYVNFTSAIT